jgi:hypothetical protein
MINLKRTILFSFAVAALAMAPVAPASAVVPWLLGRHVIAAVVGLATLAAASSTPPAAQAPYSATPVYGGPAYYAPPAYYARPSYYPATPAYSYGAAYYYRPSASYARPVQRFYGAPRGYYAPGSRYTGFYGAHVPYQSGRSAYRRR